MAEHEQCPNCGGYKTQTEKTVAIHGPSEPPTKPIKVWRTIGIFLLFPFFSCCIGLAILTGTGWLLRSWGIRGNDNGRVNGIIAVFILLLLIVIAVRVGRKFISAPISGPQVGTVYYYNCYLCGYNWSWTTGTPKPTVNVRPDLIGKGAQKLEQEEADRIARIMAEQQWKKD